MLSLKKWFQIDEKLRFLLLAGMNMAIRYLIFVIIGLLTGITHYQVILLCSWSFSVFIAFYSYKYLVFSSDGNHFYEFGKSILIWIFSYLFNVLLLTVLVERIKLNVFLSQGIIICLIFIINYYLFKHFAFAKE